MADYFARIKGHYASGRTWSTGLHITSTDTAATILSNWIAQVTSFWTDGTHGLDTVYATGTVIDTVDVATLNGTMQTVARTAPTTLSLAGTSVDTALPDRNSAVVTLRASGVGPGTIGHMKLPAPVEGTVSGGEFQSTFYDRVGVAARALLSGMTADGSQVFIFNKEATLHKPLAFTKTIMVTAQGSSKVGSQESRVKSVKPSFG